MNRYNRQWIWYIQFGKEGWRTNVAEATLNRCPTLSGAEMLCLTICILVSRSCSFISPTWILGSSNKSPLLSVTQHMQHARLGICRQASPLASPGWSLPRAIAPRPFCLLANDAHCCRTKLQIQPHSLCKCIVDHSGSHEVGLQTGPSRKTLVT